LITTVIKVWVVPSAGEVAVAGLMVDEVAEGADCWKTTCGCCVSTTVSVESVAVNVTVSAALSVTENMACPLALVTTAGPTVAVGDDAARLTILAGTGLPPGEVSKVTTAVVPTRPTWAGDGAVTVDAVGDTVRDPKVTDAFDVRTSVSVVSVAVKVAVSAVASVTVNVATPDALVKFGVAAGTMTALPVPLNVTALLATG
jgi:hypothetical protein